jgi:hypothetical protein
LNPKRLIAKISTPQKNGEIYKLYARFCREMSINFHLEYYGEKYIKYAIDSRIYLEFVDATLCYLIITHRRYDYETFHLYSMSLDFEKYRGKFIWASLEVYM